MGLVWLLTRTLSGCMWNTRLKRLTWREKTHSAYQYMNWMGKDTVCTQIPVSLMAPSACMKMKLWVAERLHPTNPCYPLRRPKQGGNPIIFPDGCLFVWRTDLKRSLRTFRTLFDSPTAWLTENLSVDCAWIAESTMWRAGHVSPCLKGTPLAQRFSFG